MAKKKNANELFWNAQQKIQLKEEYQHFLKAEGKNNSSNMAEIFAIWLKTEGVNYPGISERELNSFWPEPYPLCAIEQRIYSALKRITCMNFL